MNAKILLLVEDSQKVQNFNKRLLERQGFKVFIAMTLAETRLLLAGGLCPDAIVLDVGMPDGNGFDFLREFRKTSKIPVLMLTGFNKNKDIVQGFECGCSDYLVKPYTFDVLRVRIQNLLKITEQVPDRIVKGSLVLDVPGGHAELDGMDLRLAKKEFALLLLLAQDEGKIFGDDYIYSKIWRMPLNNDDQALRSAVYRLRKKLKGSGYTINSEYSGGYSFAREKNA